MKTINTPPSEYTISKETAIFIESIQACNDARDKLIEGLTTLYGEDSGHEMYHRDYDAKFEETEELIYHAMSLSIRNHLAFLDNTEV